MQSCRAASRLIRSRNQLISRGPPWISQLRPIQRRHLGLETITAILIPPAVFGGLLISLWTYKCIMMVVFQNKIIYMPSVPPFSRSEKVTDYAAQCRPVEWIEHEIKSKDGTRIKLLEGSVPTSEPPKKEVMVLYFQGNASSLPPRLPYLSRILSTIHRTSSVTDSSTKYTIIALSYRGFWTSKGRPSQPGIELDTSSAISWVLDRSSLDIPTRVIIWGQSIGAGAASVSLSNLLSSGSESQFKRISGLLLETPFIDLKTMLVALYPQRFLPYRYLSPFLMSSWDSKTALERIGNANSDLKVLLLQAGDDELVPGDNAGILEGICKSNGLDVKRVVIAGALHTEVMIKSQGRAEIARFIGSFGTESR